MPPKLWTYISKRKGLIMIQTREQSMELVEREFLCGSRARKPKNVNMEDVYEDFDRGMSMEEVILKHGVSESTLRRRHKEYQAKVKLLKEQAQRNVQEEDSLPPLPEDL